MRRIALCFAFLSALACSSDKKNNDDDQDQDEGTEIGPAGGQVVADDGALTLDIPAGALADNVRITATSRGAAARGVAFEGIPSIATYEFAPEGLTFAVPVVVTAVLPGVTVVTGDNARVPLVIATLDGNGQADINVRQDTKVDLDAGSTTHITEISHFSGIGYHNFSTTVELTFEPVPPAVMKYPDHYGVGVRVKSLNAWPVEFELLYDDNSSGVIGYGFGSVQATLAHFSGGNFDELVPASYYACLQPGTPTYSAHVFTDGSVAVATGQVMEYTSDGSGGSANARDLAPSWPLTGAEVVASIEVTRQIDCQPADQPEPVLGPPYSGIVQYGGVVYPYGDVWPGISATFSEGGAAQANFDASVAAIQRFYGLVPSRGLEGQCYPVDIFQYNDGESLHDTLLNPAVFLASSHVGSGGNDAVVAKFPAEVSASFDALFGSYLGFVNPSTPPAVLPSGIPVYAPADASSPIITLPGLASGATSTVNYSPSTTDFPTSGVTVSWQSNDLDAEFMHVLITAQGNLGLAAYECFVQPSTQVLNVPQTIINDLLDQSWNGSASEAHDLTIFTLLGKRQETPDAGRTLIGFFVRQAAQSYFSCGEGPC